MKTTVKLKLRASQRMPGHGSLVMHVTRHRMTRTLTTPHVLSCREWDEKEQKVIISDDILPKRKKELAVIASKLKKKLHKLQKTMKVLETSGDYTSLELLRSFRNRQQPFCGCVMKKAESLQQAGRFGTAHAYKYAAVSLLKFLNGKDVGIDKINVALMEDYERYLMKAGKSKNTVSCYMRSLRAAYNSAGREKIFSVKNRNENPFAGVFTGNAKTPKRAISKESIAKLMEVDAPEQAFSRDLFLFSFYTQGMPFTDMANLKKGNIADGFIRYKRKKTGQLITVKLEDCMKTIIRRYRERDSDFIFPILEKAKDFKDSKDIKVFNNYEKWRQTGTALNAYNKNLRKLADLAGIEEHLTSYVSRHSWASIAFQQSIPVATISRGLGHESEKTTRIYISGTDYSDVIRANKRILSYFVGKARASMARLPV